MGDVSWQQLESLLDELLVLPADTRESWLHKFCTDPDLYRQVTAILDADAAHGSVLEHAAVSGNLWNASEFAADTAPLPEVPGYRILGLLGEGGMASVFLGQRKVSGTFQQVALKRLRLSVHDPVERRRFEAEQRILARLEHPGIARFIDAGIAPDGVPWYAMEFIDGQSLIEWCDAHRAGIEQRLELIIEVCRAVHYAHQHLVIHRDIKPSNILVDAHGSVKLLDFGVAKLLDPDTSGAESTRTEHRRLTPAYAAPEQFTGKVSTASDIYTLGVLLMEMSSGHRPRIAAASTTEDRFGKLAISADKAAARKSTPKQLTRLLAGDVGTIARKAMREEPEQRYGSALAMADDLVLFLKGHPVSARPLNFVQRLGCWVLREKRLAAAIGIALIALLAGILATSILWRRSENSAGLANEVNDFLNNDVLAAANPYLEPGLDPSQVTVAAVLAHAGAKLDSNRIHNPEARARIGLTLGRAWFGLGVWEKARVRLEAALADALISQDRDSDLTLAITQQLARTATFDSQYERAGELYRQLLQARRRNPGWNQPVTIEARRGYVQLLYETGRVNDALTELDSALVAARSHAPEQVAAIEWKLSDLYTELNRWSEAEVLVRRALASSRADLGPYHLQYLWQRISLGDILLMQGQWDEAEMQFRELHEHLLHRVGHHHPMTLTAAHYLGQVSLERGDLASALDQLEMVLEERIAVHGENHKWTHYTMNRLGQALVASGRADEAIKLLARTLKLATDAEHRDQAYVLLVLDNLADAYLLKNELGAAESCLEEALGRAERILPANNFRRALLERSMGRLRELQGRSDVARAHYEYASRVFSEGFGQNHPWVMDLRTRLRLTAQAASSSGHAEVEEAAVPKVLVRPVQAVSELDGSPQLPAQLSADSCR